MWFTMPAVTASTSSSTSASSSDGRDVDVEKVYLKRR